MEGGPHSSLGNLTPYEFAMHVGLDAGCGASKGNVEVANRSWADIDYGASHPRVINGGYQPQ